MLHPSDDGTVLQGDGSGRVETSPDLSPTTRNWASSGEMKSLSPIAGPKEIRREGGLSLMFGSMDLKNKGVAVSPDAGPSNGREVVGCSKGPASSLAQVCSKACTQQLGQGGKIREGPKPLAVQEVTGLILKCSAPNYPPEAELFVAREIEDSRKLQGVVRLTETDRVLEEESMRYGKGVGSWGKREMGNSHLNSFLFDRTLGGGVFRSFWGFG